MLHVLVASLVAAVAFGLFAYAGILIARVFYADLPHLAGSPEPHDPPVRILIAVAAVLGAVCAQRGVPPPTLAIVAGVCAIMAAIWCTDSQHGIVPDALTLIPLGALTVSGLISGHWFVALAAVVPALPFAFLAWRTKGLGMGWGDVKLAALGGALLGMQDAIFTFAVAGMIAVIVTKVRRRSKNQPLAFAPYLAAAIVVPLALHTLH